MELVSKYLFLLPHKKTLVKYIELRKKKLKNKTENFPIFTDFIKVYIIKNHNRK